ncbi:MAG: NAD(P)/FAD-dependent oxidoreductase [Hyphomicrobiaceae bacterium]
MTAPGARHVVIVGGGPAGLMAADVVSRAGLAVTVLEQMPTPGRKLMLAGRGGLNLTHSEPLAAFLTRYGPAQDRLAAVIEAFPPDALLRFAHDLGQPTFIGSSGRIFPKAMKSSPLLRAWLQRLGTQGVTIRTRHRWLGLDDDGAVQFQDAAGTSGRLAADAVVLALGGASWPRLGSDGHWVAILQSWGIAVTPLAAANSGLSLPWTPAFRDRFAGQPLKRIALTCGAVRVRGEALITSGGLEGGAVYALGAAVRAALAASGRASLHLDLRPDMPLAELSERLSRPKAKQSMATWLRKSLGLTPADVALLHEARIQAAGAPLPSAPEALAALLKALPLTATGTAGLDRAISTAGGIRLDEIDHAMMLLRRPGVFAAGEMLDWKAPTGGYLLQACFATGHAAGLGVVQRLQAQ